MPRTCPAQIFPRFGSTAHQGPPNLPLLVRRDACRSANGSAPRTPRYFPARGAHRRLPKYTCRSRLARLTHRTTPDMAAAMRDTLPPPPKAASARGVRARGLPGRRAVATGAQRDTCPGRPASVRDGSVRRPGRSR